MAERSSKQANRSNTGRQPISRHPLFPAIVALWVATLIGMGSLALSTALVEKLVLAGHIDSLIPAVAPPLGATARLMLAAMLGTPAGVIGWVLAKRLGAPKNAPAPQVFNIADADLGAMPQWPGVAELPARAEPVVKPAPLLDPSSLSQEAEEEAPLSAAETVVEHEAIAAPSSLTAAQRIAAADLTDLSHVELVERLAIALQRREELFGTASDESAETASPVLHFPDFADRRTARLALPVAQSRTLPQETEKALRAALAQLERMSGTA